MLALLAAAVLAACSGPKRTPKPQPMPAPSGRAPLRVDGPLSPRLASYRIDATLDVKTRRITATQTLRWKHAGAAPVDALPFHLYMNAFKNEATVFMREAKGRHRGAHKKAADWGWIEVTSIRVGGEELRPAATYGEDETTLTVPLPRPVAPGEELAVDFTFTTQLPEAFARTGWKGEFILVGQWFPKIGVLVVDDGGAQRWHCETFHLNSEFFADFGVYDVGLTVPDTHVVAATGVLTAADPAGDGRRKLTFRAEDVHDFVWMADPYMQVARTTADGDVDIFVYHRPEQARFAPRHLEAAKRTVETFGRLFYRYPWPSMTVVDPPPDAEDSAGGMEYPMLVTTGGDSALSAPGVRLPEYVTIHEVGHNWFQGILASNEVDEAWLDEGMNDYADGIVMEEWFGRDSALDHLGLRLSSYGAELLLGSVDDLSSPVATRSYDFPSFGEYGIATYAKTSLAMRTLEQMVGRERFHAALGVYTRRFAFKHPTGRDLFATLEEALGEDLEWFLRPALHQVSRLDFRVSQIKVRPAHPPRGVFGEGDGRETRGEKEAPETGEWESEVLIVDVGTIPAIVDVDFRWDDGTVERETWDARHERWKRFRIVRKARLESVVVDADGKLALERERLENSERVWARTRAAWRAAARASFWEQTLLQLVGL